MVAGALTVALGLDSAGMLEARMVRVVRGEVVHSVAHAVEPVAMVAVAEVMAAEVEEGTELG